MATQAELSEAAELDNLLLIVLGEPPTESIRSFVKGVAKMTEVTPKFLMLSYQNHAVAESAQAFLDEKYGRKDDDPVAG